MPYSLTLIATSFAAKIITFSTGCEATLAASIAPEAMLANMTGIRCKSSTRLARGVLPVILILRLFRWGDATGRRYPRWWTIARKQELSIVATVRNMSAI